jgi:eukaryotic-like serine/threonine-protein kinase
MRYAVVERLGRGGMGVVDRATADDGRPVALKRLALHGSARAMEHARRRIRREAEVLGSLDHPAIVPLVEVLDDGDDVVLVMPYLPGGSLSDAVATGGPLPAPRVASLAGPLLGALAAAHRQGVVHRDITPGNVLFGDEGQPLLADFGVASTRDGTGGLTGTGLVVGTPAFMAPEQARGEVVGPAADVFALGATLRWALTGAGPYGGGEGSVLMARAAAGKVAALPRSVPPELRRLLTSMCHPDPRRRPTAAALAAGPEGTAVRTARRPLVARLGAGRRRAALATGAVLAGLAVAGLVALATPDGGSALAAPTPAPEAPACPDLPYQPCGEEPAPGTDGRRCLTGFDDYDGDPRTGCEAEADAVPDGSTLEPGRAVEANLVPRRDVDTWRYEVPDRFQLFCDGAVRVTFAAAVGVAQQVQVLDGDEVLATRSSADGTPVTVELGEPSCGDDDTTTFTLVVSSVGSDRTADPYRLEVTGSY